MVQEQVKLQNVSKIAILRANALGDFMVTLPAIKAIRQTYPEAELVLLGRPWHKEFLLKGRTPIDRVIVVPIMKNIRTEGDLKDEPAVIEAFFDEMKKEQFDIAISFQGNGISAIPFIQKIGAKTTLGYACDKSKKPDRYLHFYYYQSEIIRYLELVKLIGAHTPDIEPEINVLDKDSKEITDIIKRLEGKPFVAINPVATDPRRMWPLERYSELSDKIIKKGVEVVFTGAESDIEKVENIISAMKFNAITTCGELSLGGLSALLAKAVAVIGPDTGPIHLARAVNTPTIGIYWAPNLVNWGPVSRTIHRPVVSWNLTCPQCGIVPNEPYPFEPQEPCKHLISFVRDITVSQVYNEFDILWKEAQKGHPYYKYSPDFSIENNNVLKMIA